MDIFADWRFWLFLLSFCQMGLMTYGFIVIKYNDFKHLENDVVEIKNSVKDISKKVVKIDKKMAVHAEKLHTLEKVK